MKALIWPDLTDKTKKFVDMKFDPVRSGSFWISGCSFEKNDGFFEKQFSMKSFLKINFSCNFGSCLKQNPWKKVTTTTWTSSQNFPWLFQRFSRFFSYRKTKKQMENSCVHFVFPAQTKIFQAWTNRKSKVLLFSGHDFCFLLLRQTLGKREKEFQMEQTVCEQLKE